MSKELFKKILTDVGAELKHLGAQGGHEIAAALFRGDAFVMYPHAGKEVEAVEQPVVPQQQIEQRGMEM